jgi:hypothetical protein
MCSFYFNILAPGSRFRIRINRVIETGSNQDSQPCLLKNKTINRFLIATGILQVTGGKTMVSPTVFDTPYSISSFSFLVVKNKTFVFKRNHSHSYELSSDSSQCSGLAGGHHIQSPASLKGLYEEF